MTSIDVEALTVISRAEQSRFPKARQDHGGRPIEREALWEEVVLRAARVIGTGPRGTSWRAGDDLLWYVEGPMGSRHLVARGFFERT